MIILDETACVVRAEALVAVFMPKKPQRPERNPAMPTPMKVKSCWRFRPKPMMARITSSTTKTIETTFHWDRR